MPRKVIKITKLSCKWIEQAIRGKMVKFDQKIAPHTFPSASDKTFFFFLKNCLCHATCHFAHYQAKTTCRLPSLKNGQPQVKTTSHFVCQCKMTCHSSRLLHPVSSPATRFEPNCMTRQIIVVQWDFSDDLRRFLILIPFPANLRHQIDS